MLLRSTTIFLFLVFISLNTLDAQRQKRDYSPKQRIALTFSIGNTYGFNSFMPEGSQFPTFTEWKTNNINTGIGIKYFHKNRWISILDYGHYSPPYGVEVSHDFYPWSRRRATQNSGGYNHLTFQFGRRSILKNTRWQANWFVGISGKNIRNRGNSKFTFNHTEMFKLEKEDAIRHLGLALSFQAGYQLAFRGRKHGLSVMALGNLGTRYYVSRRYTAWINYEQYHASVRSKGDFLAWMIQYEVYLFNRKETPK